MADVGACLEALLAQPTICRRLARSGGLDDLAPSTIARLCVLAALHDVGKVNVGFQAQIWQPEELPRGEKIRSTGHYDHVAGPGTGAERKRRTDSGMVLEGTTMERA